MSDTKTIAKIIESNPSNEFKNHSEQLTHIHTIDTEDLWRCKDGSYLITTSSDSGLDAAATTLDDLMSGFISLMSDAITTTDFQDCLDNLDSLIKE